MSVPDRISPAALESLYRVVIKDTLDQSISKRNADDIQDLRQSLVAIERSVSHLRAAIEGFETENRELRKTTNGLEAAIQQLSSSQEQGIVDKKTVRALQQHVQQVDQRQTELETTHEGFERAFEQIAQLIEAGTEEVPHRTNAPLPARQQQQQQQSSQDGDSPFQETEADSSTAEPQLAKSGQSQLPLKAHVPIQKLQQEDRVVRTRSRISQAQKQDEAPSPQCSSIRSPRRGIPADLLVDERQTSTKKGDRNEPNTNNAKKMNPRFTNLTSHLKETRRKYAAAGEMSQAKERQFIWAFIDRLNDKETSRWIQENLLENLPSSMVHASRSRGNRIIALGLGVTWDAVLNIGLKDATLPSFLT